MPIINPGLIRTVITPVYYLPALSNLTAARGIGPVTFTRNSVANFPNASGILTSYSANTPAFYLQSGKGIFSEPAATNTILQSNAFTTTWSAIGLTSTTQNVTGPDGVANSGWTLLAAAGNSIHQRYQQNTGVAVGPITHTVVAKAGTASWLGLYFFTSPQTAGSFFDLSNGSIGTTTGVTASIVALSNGWYKCSITKTYASGTWYVGFNIQISDNQNITWNAAGTETILVANAQSENTSFATSPINTTTAAATRIATVISNPIADMPPSGPRSIKLLVTPAITPGGVLATEQVLWSSYTDADNELSIRWNGVICYALKKVAGVSEYVTVSASTWTAGTTYTVALNINLDNTLNLFVNGVQDLGGLGSELITNGNFASWTGDNPNNWSLQMTEDANNYVTQVGNACRMVASGFSGILQSVGTPYKLYKSSVNVTSVVSNDLWMVWGANNLNTYYSTTGVKTQTDFMVGTGNITFKRHAIPQDVAFTDVSLKEVYNTTTTLAPVLGTTFQIGSSNSLNQFLGNIKDVSIYRHILPGGV